METIQLHIAGRNYPLKAPAQEVPNLERAAASINQQCAAFKEQFQVNDPVDLLAMTALQLASDRPAASAERTPEVSNESLDRMHRLHHRIQAALRV